MKKKICIGNFDSGCADVWNYSLWKNNRINSGTKCNTGRAERDQDNDTSDRDVNQDGQNQQDQTQQEQTETHRMQIIWEQEQLLCMPRKGCIRLDKKRFHLEAITPETVLSQLAAARRTSIRYHSSKFYKERKDGEQVSLIWISPKSLGLTLKRWDLLQNIW